MVKIISRKSDLAIIQAFLVGDAIKTKKNNISLDFIYKDTKGDIDLTTPLSQLPEIGVFTSDLRNSLINEEADLAVHSWKDLPIEVGDKTIISTTIKRSDSRDILFIKKNEVSKKGSINILCSSPRRKYNLENFIKNYLVVPVPLLQNLRNFLKFTIFLLLLSQQTKK